MPKRLQLKPEDYRDEHKLMRECRRMNDYLTAMFMRIDMFKSMCGEFIQSEDDETVEAQYYQYAEHHRHVTELVISHIIDDLAFVNTHLSATRAALKREGLKVVS